ncbi:MAG: hypothetical protein ACRD12_24575 [Acidimicrobiales bacterium]
MLLVLVLTAVPFVVADPALASSGCDALNQPSADGFYFKGRILVSLLQAGDVVTIKAGLPVSPTPSNYVPSGFYLGIGSFDAAPIVPVVKFPGTLVYTVPKDVELVHMNWATTPSIPDGIEVAATWQVSCQNAPKSNPTLTTQASPSALLGGPVYDTATLAGGNAPTGTITLRLYGPDDAACGGPVAFTTTANVAGNGSYTSAGFTPSALGTYRWTAAYSGDSRNNTASSPCNATNESVTVRPFAPPPPTATFSGDVPGPVAVKSGQSVLVMDGQLAGPITIEAGGALRLVNSRVTSGIVATNPAFLSICNSHVAAPAVNPTQGVVVTGASTPLRIGDPANGCPGNRIAGDVRITGNTGGLTLGANTVSGNMTVDNSTVGMVVVKANTVFGTLGCAGNSPAPVNAGQTNTAATKTGQCAGL